MLQLGDVFDRRAVNEETVLGAYSRARSVLGARPMETEPDSLRPAAQCSDLRLGPINRSVDAIAKAESRNVMWITVCATNTLLS